MTGSLDGARFAGRLAPMVVQIRSGLDESIHHGAGVAMDASGAVTAAVGDPDLLVYPRSALKPLQAHAMVGLGLRLPPHLLAVVCASHSGEAMHIAAVREILHLHDLDEHHLRNTATLPYGDDARYDAIRGDVGPSSIQQNCSGKHSAMLATCRINGWDLDTYLAADHPLQRAITAVVGVLGSGSIDAVPDDPAALRAAEAHLGVDGCGAPTHTLTLRDLAMAFSTLARHHAPVATAMADHPQMVGGTGRDVTAWIGAVPGLMAKEGAAGVMAAALPDGRAMALKIADGSDVARQAATIAGLRALGVDVDAHRDVVDAVRPPVLGGGLRVGDVDALNW